MALPTADQMIIHWAADRGYPCACAAVTGLEHPCVKVVLQHAAAYIQQGRVVSIEHRNQGRFVAETARELAVVFALCGYVALFQKAPGSPEDHRLQRQPSGDSI